MMAGYVSAMKEKPYISLTPVTSHLPVRHLYQSHPNFSNPVQIVPIEAHLAKQAILIRSDCFATAGARIQFLPFRWTRVAMHITT